MFWRGCLGALRDTLNILSNSTDRVTSSNAHIFLKTISSFNFILILKFVRNIFSITTPVSCYLQSKNIDFIQTFHLIDKTKQQLVALRSNQHYNNLVEDAKQFSIDNNLLETDFKESRVRKAKKMISEEANDEVTTSASERYNLIINLISLNNLIHYSSIFCSRFKINTYFMALDQIITSITNRYNGAREILKDLVLLSPKRLIKICQKSK